MNRKYLLTFFICISSIHTTCAEEFTSPSHQSAVTTTVAQDGELYVRRKGCDKGELTLPKAPVRIPRITLSGHTLEFVTPCQGLTLQLVKGEEEVCYETVITGDTLEIPSGYEGVFELRILQGDFIFYAEIEL